jgi:hypothetical protein
VSESKRNSPKRSPKVADVLQTIKELPTEEQSAVYSELQDQEISRIIAGADEVLSSLPASDELIGSLSADITLPTLDEAGKLLMAALDHRIDACNKLKEHLRSADGPVTKDRIREWRQRAAADRASEKHVWTCRDIYGTLLRMP